MATKRKVVSIGNEAREKITRGADFFGDAIKSTFGPYGQNFLLEKGRKTSNDGFKIGAELECLDETEHQGLDAVRQGQVKMNELVGEGTTTVVVLTQAILKSAARFMGIGKNTIGQKSPGELLQQIKKERVEIMAKLLGRAIEVTTREQLIESARVSVGDDKLGELIGGMQWDLGKDGIIIAEDSNRQEPVISRVNGIRIDNGLAMPGMMTNLERQSVELNDVKVILTNHTIESITPIKPILDQLLALGTNRIIIVARAFTSQALKDLQVNIEEGKLFVPINAPYTDQNEVMKDLAAVLGGKFIHNEEGDLSDMQLSDVGFAKKLIARRYDAIFTGDDSDKSKERVAKRVEQLQDTLKGSESPFEKGLLKGRISQMTNGFAILEVGAVSGLERGRVFDKCEDAVNAVRHALQEGVVEGAGLAFKNISEELPETYLLKLPLMSLYQQIMATAPKGFAIEKWVKDPVKVLRTALEISCEVAGTLATAGGAVATERDKPLDLLLGKKE